MQNIKNYILPSCVGLIILFLSGCLANDVANIIKQRENRRAGIDPDRPPANWQPYKKAVGQGIFSVSGLTATTLDNHSVQIKGRISKCKYTLESGEQNYQRGYYSRTWGRVECDKIFTRNKVKESINWIPVKLTVYNPFGSDAKISVKADGSFSGNLSVKSKYHTKYPSKSDDGDWYRKTKNISIQPYFPPQKARFADIKYPLTIWLSWYTAQTESNAVLK